MQHQHYHICILGAGLSGMLTALMAHRAGLNICLIDKPGALRKSRNFLPLEAVTDSFFSSLAEYEIDTTHVKQDDYLVQKNSNMISAWGTTNATTFDDDNYFHINKLALHHYIRACLTERLIQIFESSAYLTYEFMDNRWFFRVSDRNTLSCDLVVDGTGRNAMFATRQKINRVFFDDHYALFRAVQANPLTGNFFMLESACNGWWYSNNANKWSQTVFISNLAKIKGKTSKKFYWDNLKETYFVKHAQENTPDMGIYVKDARCSILTQTTGTSWIAIGDSAFTLDPLSGKGNATIAENNIAIFPLVLDFLKTKQNDYLLEIDRINNKLFCSHLTQKNIYYSIEKRWPHSLFWI